MSDDNRVPSIRQPRPLQPIEDYQIPSLPTDVATKRLIAWTWHQVRAPDEAKPFVSESNLFDATRKTLEEVAGPPACGPLMQDFDEHFHAVRHGTAEGPRTQLVLLPPGDYSNVLRRWAAIHELDVTSPPERHSLRSSDQSSISEFTQSLNEQVVDGHGLLVIPELERWFLRHEDGLGFVRRLLDAIDVSARCIIAGCSTWAWEFLCKATQANLVLSSAVTFESFGSSELHDWFVELEEGSDPKWRIRLASNGVDLFSRQSGTNHYFERLAAESLGIPWVAWHRWRKSLRYHESADDQGDRARDTELAHDENDHTLWVSSLPKFNLTREHNEQATLVLQALLIHGVLSADELRTVVPIVGELRVVSSLVASGLIRRSESGLQIVPTAYPEIRQELISDGFPHPSL